MKNQFLAHKSVAVVAYIVMVIVNALANILPINNLTTGEISDSYPNLFAPAGVTFAIWGVIYTLLAAYCIYQFTAAKKNAKHEKLIRSVNVYFVISSIANTAWILFWHYRIIPMTVVLIVLMLVCFIQIAGLLRKEKLALADKLLIQLPFDVYFGWITVATIANITAFLVDAGWERLGIADSIWMMVVLVVSLGIGLARTVYDKSIAYGLVFIWAYYGIWLKHSSADGFAGKYPGVILVVLACIAVFAVTEGYLIARKR